MVTQNEYGKGRATYIATQYFSSYRAKPSPEMRNRIAEYISHCGVVPYASFKSEDMKTSSALITTAMYDKNGKVRVLTVTNSDYYPSSDTMTTASDSFRLVEEKENVKICTEDGKCSVKFELGALESFAIYVD